MSIRQTRFSHDAATAARRQSGRLRCTGLLVTMAAALLAVPAAAQPVELTQQFESRTHDNDGFSLPYRLFVPENYNPEFSYPLIVTFHGAGERGSDNNRQIAAHRIATAWADTRVQSMYAPIVVSPQAPSGGRWEDVVISATGTAAIRNEMETVLDLLDSLQTEFNVDPDRIYAAGLSLGGYGTFDAASRAPELFAAAVPMSGGYGVARAETLADVPLWIIHGESDGVVPVSLSKNMVTALEGLGRSALYMNCSHFGCSALTEAELDSAFAARPDLIYWGLPGVGHGPWAPWFDDPRVQDWLMTQHRLTEGAVSITTPDVFARVSGSYDVQWSATAATDSVSVWFSPDRGKGWQLIGAGVFESGTLSVDTAALPDTPFGRFQVQVYDGEGFMYGRAYSPAVAINNAGDAEPVVEIDRQLFKMSDTFSSDTIDLTFYAGDAESDAVDVTISYSTDNAQTFTVIEQFSHTADGGAGSRTLDLAALPNASEARFRVEASDGSQTGSDISPAFDKATTRQTSMYAEQHLGSSTPTITISFVDPAALTNHRYRIGFTVPESGPKTYEVLDTNDGFSVVLTEVPVTPYEGPLFDGMRLSIQDVEMATEDRDATGWSVGDATMRISIRAPRVTLDGESIQLLATPADYQLVITGAVSDTSSGLFGFTEHETMFYLENTTAGERRDFLFDDKNGDGMPSSLETLYILEPGENDAPTPAWFFTFVNGSPVVNPADGDVFTFVTTKPIQQDDAFFIYGTIGVDIDNGEEPGGLDLGQNYPNPFRGSTSIGFALESAGPTRLVVYDALGRVVRVLVDQALPAGRHNVDFDAMQVASGFYFYRLETGGASLSRGMVVAR